MLALQNREGKGERGPTASHGLRARRTVAPGEPVDYRMAVDVEIGRSLEEGPTYTVRLPFATVQLSVVTFQ